MPITTQPPSASLVNFVRGGAFQETFGAEFVRSEDRGVADTGTRVFLGAATLAADFLADLSDRMEDYEFSGCGLDSVRVSDASANMRRITLTFRGLMMGERDAEQADSSVFGTFSYKDANGEDATVEFEDPQTEYRYVVSGDKPTNPAFSGVANRDDRPIKVWNLQPDTAAATTIVTIERLNRFEVKHAGLAWEVSESWVRELSKPLDAGTFTTIPYVVVITPES